MMLQLNPPIWVATPLGEGFALLVIDYGPHLNSVWVVQHFADGQVVHVDAAEIRVMGNEMYDIPHPKVPVERCI
jgi:dTDP-4-dehydrorhamnose 3,5-epimerase-like enzyme